MLPHVFQLNEDLIHDTETCKCVEVQYKYITYHEDKEKVIYRWLVHQSTVTAEPKVEVALGISDYRKCFQMSSEEVHDGQWNGWLLVKGSVDFSSSLAWWSCIVHVHF